MKPLRPATDRCLPERISRRIAKLLLLIAMVLAACPGRYARAEASDVVAAGETLRVHVYPVPINNMPIVVARAKGFCTAHGVVCELKPLGTGVLALQALIGDSIDVAQPGLDTVVAAAANGSNLLAVASAEPNVVFTLVARSGVALPHATEGYPAVMQDLRGMKIGVPARGSAGEIMLQVLLLEAGMSIKDVTVVAVGTPTSGFSALTIGKIVDAEINFEPLHLLCQHTRSCASVVDLSKGEGPKSIAELNGAYVPLVMRRDFVEGNPRLVGALLAALGDAEAWMRDPAHFDELQAIFQPLVSFGDLPDGDLLRTEMLNRFIPQFDLPIRREAVAAMVRLMLSLKIVTLEVDATRLVWEKAP